MRLWSLHPRLLDRQGLTAVWREALLAQAVLAERTTGYRRHPQLERFRAHPDPLAAVGAYLWAVAEEASERGYSFDRSRVDVPPEVTRAEVPRIPVTEGQVAYEWWHLLAKLRDRSPQRLDMLGPDALPSTHPLFTVIPGPIASWERPG